MTAAQPTCATSPRRRYSHLIFALIASLPLNAQAVDSTGLIPLDELGAGLYKGQTGGLYPDGANTLPADHLAAGLERALQIRPLAPDGTPAADGKIVLLAVGMSSTMQHFRSFIALAQDDQRIHPDVTLINGAIAGQSANRTADPDAPYWRSVDDLIESQDATTEQVQVVWMKQAIPFPSAPFPREVERLQDFLLSNVHILADRFPNLKLVYLSNHIYGGYTASNLNAEPHAYENGFAVKWIIADQIAGLPELNYDPATGPVRAPWLAWGPNVWGDGLTARADGVVFAREDFAADGSHPSPSGERKVAQLLLDFLLGDPTAQPWFAAEPVPSSVEAASWGRTKRDALAPAQ